jgi:hypothetical protein
MVYILRFVPFYYVLYAILQQGATSPEIKYNQTSDKQPYVWRPAHLKGSFP